MPYANNQPLYIKAKAKPQVPAFYCGKESDALKAEALGKLHPICVMLSSEKGQIQLINVLLDEDRPNSNSALWGGPSRAYNGTSDALQGTISGNTHKPGTTINLCIK
jgi:hypothetical protein